MTIIEKFLLKLKNRYSFYRLIFVDHQELHIHSHLRL